MIGMRVMRSPTPADVVDEREATIDLPIVRAANPNSGGEFDEQEVETVAPLMRWYQVLTSDTQVTGEGRQP